MNTSTDCCCWSTYVYRYERSITIKNGKKKEKRMKEGKKLEKIEHNEVVQVLGTKSINRQYIIPLRITSNRIKLQIIKIKQNKSNDNITLNIRSAKYLFFRKCLKKLLNVYSNFFFYLKVQFFRLIMENNFIQIAATVGHAVA